MKEWNNFKENPPRKSGYYKIKLKNENIHYCKYIYHHNFVSGYNNDYRNGQPYPVMEPFEYIYLFGLDDNWEPDESVTYEDFPLGI